MTWSVRLKGLMSAVCCLLPLAVAAESRLGAEGQRSTAHVMFKIVIPQVLSVQIGQMLSVGGNDRSVFLLATDGTAAERHQVILSASGHRSVARFAACSPAARDAAATNAMNCTVSMP
jgi:hypothetical protein